MVDGLMAEWGSFFVFLYFCIFAFAEVLAQFKPAAGGRCEWAKNRAATACSCATEGKLLQGQERAGAVISNYLLTSLVCLDTIN